MSHRYEMTNFCGAQSNEKQLDNKNSTNFESDSYIGVLDFSCRGAKARSKQSQKLLEADSAVWFYSNPFKKLLDQLVCRPFEATGLADKFQFFSA
jgi:hypothetical protein